MGEFFSSKRDIPEKLGNVSPLVLVRLSERKQIESFYSHKNNLWYSTGFCLESGERRRLSLDEEKEIVERMNKNAVLWKYWY